MKALILAAGYGTRLRPLTNTVPKPLVPINGVPLLQFHFDHLARHGVTEILINTHYLAEGVYTFVHEYQQMHPSLHIHTIFEESLLGSAGTLHANREFFRGETDFLVVYADNLTDIAYTTLLEKHRVSDSVVTIATYCEAHPEQKGIIECDATGRIRRFLEKPKLGETNSTLANAGIYACNELLFSYLETMHESPLDFGKHVFPHLLAQDIPMQTYSMTETLLDIGTPENYERAPALLKFMNLG